MSDQHLTLTTKLCVYQVLVLSVLIYTYSRHVDSSCSRHESIRGFPHEMLATDTRYSQVRFHQQHRHPGAYWPHAWERRSCSHGALQTRWSVCRSSSWLWLETTSWLTLNSLDRSSLAGLVHLTSGTLEACLMMWSWCWSDTTVLAGYAILMMMFQQECCFPGVMMVMCMLVSCISCMAISCHVPAVWIAVGYKICVLSSLVYLSYLVLYCLLGCCIWFGCCVALWVSIACTACVGLGLFIIVIAVIIIIKF